MSPAGNAVPEDGSDRRIVGLWAAPIAVLVVVWLWLAFSSGGFIARHWLLPSLSLGLFGLVVSLLAAYPRRPRQLSLAVLAFFGSYSVWVALSALWAASATRVWMESGRTFGYLLVFGLALIYFTDTAARQAFRYLLMAASLFLLCVCVWKLWSTNNLAGLFIGKRFYYPVRYPNNAAALFLVGFWPLLWLAAGSEERAPLRGVALGLATGLLGLTVMTQSRGAMWSLAFSLVIMFVLSPVRMRTLVYLLVPVLLMVYEFPILNRYWLEGPEAVEGGLGARTILVAAIMAGFIGTILALLERWIKISGRTKVVVNSLVTVAVIAAVGYGVMTLSSDAGGPVKWVSRTWHQFFGQTAAVPEDSHTSRFAMISDSGRVDLWRVAWREFEEAPILGVGADNYVFEYYRLRTSERRNVQQAHSFELQVLGETGVVGGVFAFGGILLALLGVLWPRCAAGWRGARATWLGRRRQPDPSPAGGASTVCCSRRWGNDPRAYGWEMALLGGATYWFIHASVDWLWQMPGVTIPAILFVAAGVADIDWRAGILWPRANRWLRIGGSPPPTGLASSEAGQSQTPANAMEVLASDKTPRSGGSPTRRGLSHRALKAKRRGRRAMRRARTEARLQPPGVLSHAFRMLVVTLSLMVLILAGLPYLSLLFQDSARTLAKTDGVRAVERAGAAHWFQPADPGPYVTQADIYFSAALAAAKSGEPDRAGAVADNLALSIDRLEAAVALEPADWALHYQAGMAALNLLLARECAAGHDPGIENTIPAPLVPGLEDWSPLIGSGESPPRPGAAKNSLAATDETREISASLGNLSQKELADLAKGFFETARERNPLASQIAAALALAKRLEIN